MTIYLTEAGNDHGQKRPFPKKEKTSCQTFLDSIAVFSLLL